MAKAAPTDINFKGVSGSARRIHVPEGDYLIRGKSVEATESKKTKNPMWVIRWEFVNGPKQGAEIIDRVVLVQQSLFRLRNLLEACGIKVPEGKLTVDPNKIIKMTQRKPIGAQIVDDDAYEGHIPSTVKRYIPADEVQDTPEGDDDEPEDDDELDIDEDDIDELEDDEDDEFEEDDEDDDLEEDDDENEEDEEFEDELYTEEELEELELAELKGVAKEVGVPVKKGKKSATYIREILAAQEAEDEELEDEEEDEPEPEPEPAPRRRRAKKATAKKAAPKKRASSAAEELEDFDLDDLE